MTGAAVVKLATSSEARSSAGHDRPTAAERAVRRGAGRSARGPRAQRHRRRHRQFRWRASRPPRRDRSSAGARQGARAESGGAHLRAASPPFLSPRRAALPPRVFFPPEEPLFRLTDERAKLRLLAATGLGGAIVLRFDAALAGLSAQAFVARILVARFAVAGVAIGFDFHFGLNRAGSPDYLAAQGAKLGFAVDVVPRFEDAGRPVRSGPIR